MITEIKMDSIASFKCQTQLETDKKINLIYGLNGTGKSTISNYLYDSDNPQFTQCRKIPELSEPILVYNQAFIEDNFYVSDSLKGIFSLSKENKAAEEKVSKATSTLVELEQSLERRRKERQQITAAFEKQKQQAINEIWKIKGTYTGGDRVLEYCLEGLKGKKDKLFDYIHSIQKPPSQPDKSIQGLRKEVESLKGESATAQSKLPLLNFASQANESDIIFTEAIVGNTDSQVAELIENLGNADWVRQGLGYIPELEGEDILPCPFCQENTITEKLINSVKNYFDDTYQKQIDNLEQIKTKYVSGRDALRDISLYTNHQFAENNVPSLTKKHQRLLDLLADNISCIDQKIKNPKLAQTLKSSADAITVFNDEVKAINREIEVYNDRLKNRDAALTSLKGEFWLIMRWQYDQTIARFEKDRLEVNKKLKEKNEEVQKIDSDIIAAKAQISAAQKETVNIDEAVNAINSGLVDIGIDDFKVVKYSDILYRIVRTGESEDAFRTLSEGEKMMISFLYFCELCKGRSSANDTHAKRIAVIDDPISSLSHVFIFNVGQLIRSVFFKSNRFSQIFVLTHSLYFFYELTDPNHERRKENQKLFRITKSAAGSEIQEMKYEEIQNDYQSYWSIINDPTQPPALIANCMRNIVEYFFNFVRKKDLNNVFLMPQLQEVKYQAFCRYVNRESHSLGQNLIDLKEFNYGVFKEGLRLVFDKTGYSDHFKAMSKM